jgi:hypothetical protein
LIPVSAELLTTVDEYLLTAYPLLEPSPVGTDYLWYGVWKIGDRVIGLKPSPSGASRTAVKALTEYRSANRQTEDPLDPA